jgi:hypothetical protein
LVYKNLATRQDDSKNCKTLNLQLYIVYLVYFEKNLATRQDKSKNIVSAGNSLICKSYFGRRQTFPFLLPQNLAPNFLSVCEKVVEARDLHLVHFN